MALRTFNSLALCAGVGGLELGIKIARADHRLVGIVERQAYAAAVLVAAMVRGDLDEAPIFDDVTRFDGKPWRGVVDLVVAGYPCQPESVAGNRKGEADERWIWDHVWRITQECGARFLFCENVAGHISGTFRRVLVDLAACGWSVEWDLVPASAVGAPHIRERVFFLAVAPDADRDELRQLAEWHQRDRGSERAPEREPAEPVDDGEGWDAPDDGDTGRVGLETQARRNAGRSPDGGHVADQASLSPGRRRATKRARALDEFPDDVRARLADLVAQGRALWDWRAAPEPTIFGVADGVAATMDRAGRDEDERLHAIGNAVVPLAAAYAFTVLWWRHFGELCR